mgnify:CR=1 FL=1
MKDFKLPLYIPKTYTNSTKQKIEKVCNGCGAKGGIKFPSSFLGVKIKTACNVHDWMFEEGVTLGDYFFSNLMFFWNLFALIWNSSNWFTISIRTPMVMSYFLATMSKRGQEAFWVNGKVENKNKHITIRGEFT